MVGNFQMPPIGFGPGSQPTEEEGKELEYMKLPQDMRSYTAHFPDVEVDETLKPALDLMAEVAAAAIAAAKGGPSVQFDLSHLDAVNRALISETMGSGEVAMKVHDIPAIAVQESVFAGVWCLRGAGLDAIEVGQVPNAALSRAFVARTPAGGVNTPTRPGVVNAPPLLAELQDKSATFDPAADAHVINLSLLPHTEQDLEWLKSALGSGSVDILSRGYGNCRLESTALPYVWRVQFFNSMDSLILDTFEVTQMPEVALAASEDLADSGERIIEVLEAIR